MSSRCLISEDPRWYHSSITLLFGFWPFYSDIPRWRQQTFYAEFAWVVEAGRRQALRAKQMKEEEKRQARRKKPAGSASGDANGQTARPDNRGSWWGFSRRRARSAAAHDGVSDTGDAPRRLGGGRSERSFDDTSSSGGDSVSEAVLGRGRFFDGGGRSRYQGKDVDGGKERSEERSARLLREHVAAANSAAAVDGGPMRLRDLSTELSSASSAAHDARFHEARAATARRALQMRSMSGDGDGNGAVAGGGSSAGGAAEEGRSQSRGPLRRLWGSRGPTPSRDMLGPSLGQPGVDGAPPRADSRRCACEAHARRLPAANCRRQRAFNTCQCADERQKFIGQSTPYFVVRFHHRMRTLDTTQASIASRAWRWGSRSRPLKTPAAAPAARIPPLPRPRRRFSGAAGGGSCCPRCPWPCR